MSRSRRSFLKLSSASAAAMAPLTSLVSESADGQKSLEDSSQKGDQRLNLAALHRWESLRYGMFIHFGMSTYLAEELPDGQADIKTYNPDRLDVDQWIRTAKDAGMTYAVLTTKHVAGHCLWPSRHTDYTVANSPNTTDVVQAFVNACRKYEIQPGFYYCSWDNHHKFGSKTPSDLRWNLRMTQFPEKREANGEYPEYPYTSSMYQTFQTAQIKELIETYSPVMEMWIDIPATLGLGYRTYLYEEITRMTPETIVVTNTGLLPQSLGGGYNAWGGWPTDVMTAERANHLPQEPDATFEKWWDVFDRHCYVPAEFCETIGKEWFWVEGDHPRAHEELVREWLLTQKLGLNYLLDVPPNRHGVIPGEHVDALMRLREAVKI